MTNSTSVTHRTNRTHRTNTKSETQKCKMKNENEKIGNGEWKVRNENGK